MTKAIWFKCLSALISLSFCAFWRFDCAWAESLAELSRLSEGKVSITLLGNSTEAELVVEGLPASELMLQTHVLADPARLVFDLALRGSKTNSQVKILHGPEWLLGMRIGSNPDRLRVVLDVLEVDDLDRNLIQSGSELRIVLTKRIPEVSKVVAIEESQNTQTSAEPDPVLKPYSEPLDLQSKYEPKPALELKPKPLESKLTLPKPVRRDFYEPEETFSWHLILSLLVSAGLLGLVLRHFLRRQRFSQPMYTMLYRESEMARSQPHRPVDPKPTHGAAPRPTRIANVNLSHCYSVLDLGEGASDQELKHRYRVLMKKFHSDTLASQGVPDAVMKSSDEKVKLVKEAYDILRQARERRSSNESENKP